MTHDEVAEWFAQRVRGGAQATKHRVSKNSRAFLRFARERGYITADLASAIEPFRPGGARVEWLDWDDIHRLISAIPEQRYRFAASWLFWTGCRVDEAVTATHQDVRWRKDVRLFEWRIPDSKTHAPRNVWLPNTLKTSLEGIRANTQPKPDWPILWDATGRGFGRKEDCASPITAKTINNALERARAAIALPTKVTAHIAKHSYCTNWINEHGADELAMEKLSRQVGTSVPVLRSTYVHIVLSDSDWQNIADFGGRP